ncbi:hypothetical protein BKA70DRAFT_1239020 [Coprinopsis sp. MPI-PUGE-AT-0042]|nr:hypothetical protein BKA70DRAFT_1239020 [Coprinopsis sp. MPI-PUGE-AT-0042]
MAQPTPESVDHVEQRPTVFALRERILSAHLHLAHRVAYLLSTVHLPFGETRAMMKEHDVIISGSGALHVLMACTWSVNDIDLYCGQGRVQPVAEFLRQHGYAPVVPNNPGSDDTAKDEDYVSLRTVGSIRSFRHSVHQTKVDVIESATSSCIAPLLEFHSTPVMNWIAYDGVVSLYPELTMELRGLTNGIRLGYGDDARAGVLKYTTRGFLIEDRTMVGGMYLDDSPRPLFDGKLFSFAFEPDRAMHAHQHQVSWMLSRMPVEKELCLYPNTTGVVGWIEVDGDRVYQKAPMPRLVWIDQ